VAGVLADEPVEAATVAVFFAGGSQFYGGLEVIG